MRASSLGELKTDAWAHSATMGADGVGVLTFRRAFAPSQKRLLLVDLAERAAAQTIVLQSKGISAAFVVDDEAARASGAQVLGGTPLALQTAGSNFGALWDLAARAPDDAGSGGGGLALDRLTSNDIYAMLQTYGVEAARATIVQEIRGVFGVCVPSRARLFSDCVRL